MGDGSIIPTAAPSDNATFTVLIDGRELSGECHVVSLVVTKMANRITQARIVLLDGDAAGESFSISSSALFVPGKSVEIQAGYHSRESTIFRGIVIRHAIKAGRRGASTLIADCRHEAVKLTVGRKSAYYHNMKDSDVFQSLLGTYSLTADVDTTAVQHRELVQYACTDWDFMVNRAEVNGMQVLTNGDGVAVKSPNTSARPKLTVLYGSTVLEFEAEIDARDQLPPVTARSWDAANQSLLAPQGAEPQITLPGNLTASSLSQVLGQSDFTVQHGGCRREPEIRTWADAQSLKSRLSKVRGRVKFTGYGDVNPGDTVELKGFGDRFNGTAFVTGVRHEIAGGLWTTDAQFGGSPLWFTEDREVGARPASGLIPAVRGLQVGIVTQLQGDPDGEDRIQVTMPLVNGNDSGTWARLATLDAGSQRGSFFRPEIGDEVIVGFLNEDPRDPIVLGMMNSSAKPAPISSSDDNHEKGFVTRSGMKLLFNDDKKSISIETPAGKSVSLDEAAGTISVKDENGNKIDMGSQGITLESQGDITLKAGGTLTVGGSSVGFKADQSIKVEGSAGAEFTSAGVMVIKGSLVQIN